MLRTYLPDSSAVLMIGRPGIGMMEFNVSIVKDYLDSDEVVIFVSIDSGAPDVMKLMSSFGIDVPARLGKSLFFLDYHSTLLGAEQERSSRDQGVRPISDLEGIMFNIAAIKNETGKRVKVFLFSLSTLFLYNQANVVLKFFQISSSRIRSDFGSVIASVHDGVHDEKITNHLMAISDGVIELRFDEDLNKVMRVRHMRGYPTASLWVPFEILLAGDEKKPDLLEWK